MSPVERKLHRSGLSTTGDSLHHRHNLLGHVACMDPGVPARDALRLMTDTYEGRKPAGEDGGPQRLARQGSG